MRRLVAAFLSAQLLGGCSFALVSGPPANHRELPVVDCTTSRVGPVLDSIFTAIEVLNLLGAASQSDEEWDTNPAFNNDPPFSRKTGLALYGALAALGGAGMYYGFSRTAACRSAKHELMIRASSGQQPQPGTWPPPQPGTWPPPQQAPAPAPGPGTWPPPQAPAPAAPPPAAPAPPAPAPPAPAPAPSAEPASAPAPPG